MSNRSSTYNTIYKVIDNNNYNILYQPSNTAFDLILQNTDLNIEYVNDTLMNKYYDTYLLSNILEHTNIRDNIIYKYGIPDVMCFHRCVPDKFKKEDLYIFKQTSGRSYKILFHDQIRNSWLIKDKFTYNIDYGIPECNILNVSNKKSLVFFNTQKNNNLDNLYEYIKNTFPDALMIRDISKYNYEDLVNTLAEYKLCIEHDTLINCIVSAYAGCKVLTSLPELPNINGHFNITDYTKIIDIISLHLNKSDLPIDKNQILLNYPFPEFVNNFLRCMKDLKRISVLP